ncbi:transcriptional regulator [Streptomyces tateyamensis]|uniref:Transcriptional regulator n=1 Tax=Streptomyces tateyamensis TaxID=565073 RepID=A0A2V4P1Z8_9ACTN|nr:DUF5324 family protein [Streptomyces tateyamensis]PYC87544.1 transcriptional regulator [Streptomyces tateyamensis]
MTRLDTARETAGKTLETLAPYAATAKETAAHYGTEARQRLGPAVEALGPRLEAAAEQAKAGTVHAAHSARVGYTRHLAPHVEQAFAALPPRTQQSTLKAVHRAQEAALAAKLSADHALPRLTGALEDARAAAAPVVQEAQARSAAAFTALHGHVSAAEIEKLAARNARRARRSRLATALAVVGTLAVGSGVLVWAWCRRSSEPDWLVEPPEVQTPPDRVHPVSRDTTTPGSAAATTPLNGTGPATEPAAEEQREDD